eukprot:331839-Pleurochrysis_carterae.AAC.1
MGRWQRHERTLVAAKSAATRANIAGIGRIQISLRQALYGIILYDVVQICPAHAHASAPAFDCWAGLTRARERELHGDDTLGRARERAPRTRGSARSLAQLRNGRKACARRGRLGGCFATGSAGA